jgi:release factor glutamine methyltransferase
MPMQIQQALSAACSALGVERLDAQLLLLHTLGRPLLDRAWLLAHDTDALDSDTEMRYIQLTRRRAAGTPLAYLTGHQEFYGLDLQVDPRVLIPRPDTESLVDWALECISGLQTPQVLDLGTGSGAIALAIQSRRPDARVLAVDLSADALSVAQNNARHLNLPVSFLQGDWLEQLKQPFDLIVSNPPYIAEGDSHLEQLGHEPNLALTSGPDGLRDIRKIVAHAQAHLTPQGWLLLEHGYDQAANVRELLETAVYAQVQSRRDLPGIERCSGGQRG